MNHDLRMWLLSQCSIEHALDYHFGDLVSRRHNEVRDAFGDLASLVWSPVMKEPVGDNLNGIHVQTVQLLYCMM